MKTPDLLDNFDKEILRTLQEDNKTSLKLLSEKVCLSIASVQRRIKKMEDSGVISTNTAVKEILFRTADTAVLLRDRRRRFYPDPSRFKHGRI